MPAAVDQRVGRREHAGPGAVGARERVAGGPERLVAKLRVYTISDQDDAGRWLRSEFPSLLHREPQHADSKEYWLATWTGISGDRHYRNGPCTVRTRRQSVAQRTRDRGPRPAGRAVPKLAYIMEGDTPCFLGLIENGLAGDRDPA